MAWMSSFGRWSRWNARRSAVFGPMPGSFTNSATKASIEAARPAIGSAPGAGGGARAAAEQLGSGADDGRGSGLGLGFQRLRRRRDVPVGDGLRRVGTQRRRGLRAREPVHHDDLQAADPAGRLAQGLLNEGAMLGAIQRLLVEPERRREPEREPAGGQPDRLGLQQIGGGGHLARLDSLEDLRPLPLDLLKGDRGL